MHIRNWLLGAALLFPLALPAAAQPWDRDRDRDRNPPPPPAPYYPDQPGDRDRDRYPPPPPPPYYPNQRRDRDYPRDRDYGRYPDRPRERDQGGERSLWVYGNDRDFRQQSSGKWVEDGEDGRYYYQEVRRTPDCIELYDPDRRINVRLYDDHMLSKAADSPEWNFGSRGHWRQ